ncbi:WbbJ Acetyltransferase (isoleucine patch superfamily) [Comamonadaceae bacterium]
MIRSLIEIAASKIKGGPYHLDPKLPLSALSSFVCRRALGLLRCVFFGVKFSLDIRKLVFVEPNVCLRNRKFISIGPGATLGRGVTIDGLSESGVNIGRGVNIGPYSIIEATGVITNLGKGCTIGANSGLGAFSFIGAAGGVTIGSDVIMGQRVSFHSENHRFDDTEVVIRKQGVTREGITIGDNCWVGANVVFLDGAKVGSGCVVAAGAVVRGVFPPNCVIGGVPAKVLKTRV